VSSWLASAGLVFTAAGVLLIGRRLVADAVNLRGPNNVAVVVFAGLIGVPLWLTVRQEMYGTAAALTVASVATGLATIYLNAARALDALPHDGRGVWHPVDEREALKLWAGFGTFGQSSQGVIFRDQHPANVRVWSLRRDSSGTPHPGGPLPWLAEIGPASRPIGYARFEPNESHRRLVLLAKQVRQD
jgi:hypothetical protein